MGIEAQGWKDPKEIFVQPEESKEAPNPDFTEKATPVTKPVEAMQVESRLRKGGYESKNGEFAERMLTQEEMKHIENDPYFNDGTDSEKVRKVREYINKKDKLN